MERSLKERAFQLWIMWEVAHDVILKLLYLFIGVICVSDPRQYQLISVRISAYDIRRNIDIFQLFHHLTYSPKREEIGDAKDGLPRLDLPSFFHRHHLTGLRLKHAVWLYASPSVIGLCYQVGMRLNNVAPPGL